MSDYDHGPLRTYRITWRSGQAETVQGHQVLFDSHRLSSMAGFSALFGGTAAGTRSDLPPRFTIHGSFDGHWRMVMTAPEEDMLSVRDVTEDAPLPWEDPVPSADGTAPAGGADPAGAGS